MFFIGLASLVLLGILSLVRFAGDPAGTLFLPSSPDGLLDPFGPAPYSLPPLSGTAWCDLVGHGLWVLALPLGLLWLVVRLLLLPVPALTLPKEESPCGTR